LFREPCKSVLSPNLHLHKEIVYSEDIRLKGEDHAGHTG